MEQIVAECKSLRDKLSRDTRLKDKLMQALKRNELQLKQARDALANTQQQHERTQAQVTQNTSSFLYIYTSRSPHLDINNDIKHHKRVFLIFQILQHLQQLLLMQIICLHFRIAVKSFCSYVWKD